MLEQDRPSGLRAQSDERDELDAERRETQKMEAVGRLAGGIAHDFNNLLTTISGYTDLLLQSTPPDDPRHEDLLEISTAARRAAVITRQLLALSRRQVLRPRKLDLNDLVAGMTEAVHELLGEGIDLELVLDPLLEPVEVDPGRMQEVIANLALNAKQTMQGGGGLVMATANAQEEDGPRVLLVITDTGPGVDEHVRSHLFEPFFVKETGSTSGLGLSTVYGIIKQSGGSISVASGSGQGSTFRISLPVASPGSAEVDPDPLQLSLSLLGQTILLVDDEDTVRRLTARTLRQAGFQVLEAADGVEALGLLRGNSKKIHLLLTDVVMPAMDGRELARKVAAMRPGVKVIFMSGYPAQTDGEGSGGIAGSAFLDKPFTQEGLLGKIRDALGG